MVDHANTDANLPGQAQEDDESAARHNKRRARDVTYPRKRSVRACHVCRLRKTKCDNLQPQCGFCASLGINCDYGDATKDNSTFDAASLEILRQLGKLNEAQDEIRKLLQSRPGASKLGTSPVPLTTETSQTRIQVKSPLPFHGGHEGRTTRSESHPVSSPFSSSAYLWLNSLTGKEEAKTASIGDSSVVPAVHLEDVRNVPSYHGAIGASITCSVSSPPQRIVLGRSDGPPGGFPPWMAAEYLSLTGQEMEMLNYFCKVLCPYFEIFDETCTFSSAVPILARRNAGLMSAILALSSSRLATAERSPLPKERHDLSTEYYYRALRYAGESMQFPTYRSSPELTATAIIISTYEMLNGSSEAWQSHLQGVFYILRSRLIEVEQNSLESTIWWTWLQQDIWAAFQERRRVFSTWAPKQSCSDLLGHEFAVRSLWILAQAVNVCSPQAADGDTSLVSYWLAEVTRVQAMVDEWSDQAFVKLPAVKLSPGREGEMFAPRTMSPSCFGLALQAKHVSQLLLRSCLPCSNGIDAVLLRQRQVRADVVAICEFGLGIVDEALTLLSSQFCYIAGLYAQDIRERHDIYTILDDHHIRCHWPVTSLSESLKKLHAMS